MLSNFVPIEALNQQDCRIGITANQSFHGKRDEGPLGVESVLDDISFVHERL